MVCGRGPEAPGWAQIQSAGQGAELSRPPGNFSLAREYHRAAATGAIARFWAENCRL